MATLTNEHRPTSSLVLDSNLFDDEDDNDLVSEENSLSKPKDSMNKRKRTKKKKPQKSFDTIASLIDANEAAAPVKEKEAGDENADPDTTEIEIELVPEEIKLEKNFEEFSKIFDHFKVIFPINGKQIRILNNCYFLKFLGPDTKEVKKEDGSEKKLVGLKLLHARMFEEDEEDEKDKDGDKTADGQPKMSKKKLKKITRLSVAALKQLVNRPDVVEMHDVTARDPKLLVHLKATRNTVAVPRHWCAKRKYLQGKRGFEKPAFDLPDFIKRTGIQGMREALNEKVNHRKWTLCVNTLKMFC